MGLGTSSEIAAQIEKLHPGRLSTETTSGRVKQTVGYNMVASKLSLLCGRVFAAGSERRGKRTYRFLSDFQGCASAAEVRGVLRAKEKKTRQRTPGAAREARSAMNKVCAFGALAGR